MQLWSGKFGKPYLLEGNSANVHCTSIKYKMCYNVRVNSMQSVCSAPYGLISFRLISKRLWAETWNLKWGFSYNVIIRLKFMQKRAEIYRYESIQYMCNINGIIHHVIQLVTMIFESVPTLEVHKKWHIFVVMEDCYFPKKFRKKMVRIFFFICSLSFLLR